MCIKPFPTKQFVIKLLLFGKHELNKTCPGNKLKMTELGGKCVSAPGYNHKNGLIAEF